MNLSFTLNGTRTALQARSFERLIDVLKEQCALDSISDGCRKGECGACLVLLDGDLVHSCLIPAFRIHGRQIQTVEGLKRDRLFADISASLAGSLCEFCSSAVLLTVYHTLSRTTRPTPYQIEQALSCITCHCAGLPSTLDAVIELSRSRRSR